MMVNEIIIPENLVEQLLLQAAEQETSVEEIVIYAITKQITERRDNGGE